jgi:hypothetical protein
MCKMQTQTKDMLITKTANNGRLRASESKSAGNHYELRLWLITNYNVFTPQNQNQTHNQQISKYKYTNKNVFIITHPTAFVNYLDPWTAISLSYCCLYLNKLHVLGLGCDKGHLHIPAHSSMKICIINGQNERKHLHTVTVHSP